MRCLAVLMIASVLAAVEGGALRIDGDHWLRPGTAWRCTIQRAVAGVDADLGPATLTVAVVQGARTLAQVVLDIQRLGQLRAGVGVVLFANDPDPAGPGVEARAILIAGGGLRETMASPLALPERARLALDAAYKRLLASGERDPLPWLWVEQGAALAVGPATVAALSDLATLVSRLDAWNAGRRETEAGAPTWALRCPVDGSVQPYRLNRPSGLASPRPVLVFADLRHAPTKERWPMLDAAALDAAGAAGCAVIETYPAGDVRHRGIAVTRVEATLAAACERLGQPKPERIAIVAFGAGAQGAVRWAEEHPDAVASLTLVSPWFAGETAAGDATQQWLDLRRIPGRRAPHLVGVAIAGTIGASAVAWQERLRQAGVAITALPDADASLWRPREQPPGSVRAYVVAAPRRYGAVEVDELTAWGKAGTLQWLAPDALRTSGIARLAIAPPTPGCTVDGKPYRAPGHPPGDQRKRLGHALGPVDAYADGPFVVIRGTGESEAAAAANARLEADLVRAWVAHAQGVPPRVDDQRFAVGDFARHHLVLIGNPRSNTVLARFVEDGLSLPVAWDDRTLTVADQRWPRADRRALALCWPHPADDGRLLVVLDGALPPVEDGGLPLTGLGDLWLGPVPGETNPALRRLFASDWR
ncbi:MAG: hypothetical protein H0W72_01760 [Planctomycetes bacterium]|nr:hypothetical protein [Planctomycetota bacterium]